MKCIKLLPLVLVFCLSQVVSGQDSGKKSEKMITLSGTVKTKDHSPVAGVEFYLDNIKTNFTTKSNGSYKIKVSPSAVNLEVRSLNYGTIKVPINNQKKIDFILTETSENKLFTSDISVKDSTLGGKVKSSSNKKPKKIITYTDIYQMIRAEVSGVIVSGRSIQIQQGHSFLGGNVPLFVVNGLVVPSIDNINPLEVKTITVLKGSSAAIYGLRGSNGVLCITLKNGSEKEQ